MSEASQYFAVELAGDIVGHLVQKGDYARFNWRREYWDNPRRAILGLSFEDQKGEGVASKLRLPPWFSNLLPEGPLRQWIALQRQVPLSREMELLAEIGHDLPGGAQVRQLAEAPAGDWAPEDFFAALEPPPVTPPRVGFHFSLAGVGLKFSMLKVGDRLTLPGRDELGDWIVKMPDASFPLVPLNEYATMTFARLVGIEVPNIALRHRDELPDLPSSAWPRGEDQAYIIERFDRRGGERIHMEDLAQVRGFYADQKYEGSFETLAALVHRRYDEDSLAQFVRRLAFSFLVGNGDMHMKNWTLLYDNPSRPRLSPAYDLVSTSPYAQVERRTEDLGLKLAGSRRFATINRRSFLRLADKIGADVALVDATLDDLIQRTETVGEQALAGFQNIPNVHAWLTGWIPQALRKLR